jgi:hypothetical protein
MTDALNGRFSEAYGFQLSDIQVAHDMVIFPYFDTAESIWEHWEEVEEQQQRVKIFVSGFQSASALYALDLPQVLKQARLKQNKDSSNNSSSLSKTFFSMVSAAITTKGSNSGSSKTVKDERTWNRSVRCSVLTASSSFIDTKRRILRISIDPYSTLIAGADTLGRVTLYDLQGECAIRIWKGVRDAYLGWCIDDDSELTPSSSTASLPTLLNNKDTKISSLSLNLIIFAPLLGLVSVYKMKHGPCIRVIPVGLSCRLIPLFSPIIYDNSG